MGPINFGSAHRDRHIALAAKRLVEHDRLLTPLRSYIIINTSRFARFRRNSTAYSFGRLLGCLIHADQRFIRVIRSPVNFKNVFHRPDKLHWRLGEYTTYISTRASILFLKCLSNGFVEDVILPRKNGHKVMRIFYTQVAQSQREFCIQE